MRAHVMENRFIKHKGICLVSILTEREKPRQHFMLSTTLYKTLPRFTEKRTAEFAEPNDTDRISTYENNPIHSLRNSSSFISKSCEVSARLVCLLQTAYLIAVGFKEPWRHRRSLTKFVSSNIKEMGFS